VIKVFTANAKTHRDALIRAAMADGETSKTWGYRERPIKKGDKEIILHALYHATTDGQWENKGEFLVSYGDDYIQFQFEWVPKGDKNVTASEKLQGRLIENLITYFRPKADFKRLEVTFGETMRNLK
jgi:hypothetical protein